MNLTQERVKKSHLLIFTLALFFYTFLIIKFVWSDNLSSFSSDSANYLLMGLYMSPWHEASDITKALWPSQDFPPFYPFVLAITGSIHNIAYAHAITALFLVISLPIFYCFIYKYFNKPFHAFAITALFAISPSTWVNSLGILSENLYLFISLLILILFPKINKSNIFFTCLFGGLLTILILTRTIGVAMLAAFIVTGFYMLKQNKLDGIKYLIPISIAITINIFAKIFSKSSLPSTYINELQSIHFGQQYQSLIDAWFSAWQYYWLSDQIIIYFIILVIGACSIIGLIIRLRKFKIDAFYILFYIIILLLWPHPGQALRFIFPIQAILLFYTFYSIKFLFNNVTEKKLDKIILLLLLIVFSAVAPTLSYTFNRYIAGKELGYENIKEFYLEPDLEVAKAEASIQKTMFLDMEKINETTSLESNILYFEPVYVGLLANRHSEEIIFINNSEGISIKKQPDVDYILLTRLHPRKTRKSVNGLHTYQYFKDWTEILWVSHSNETGEPVSYFLRTK